MIFVIGCGENNQQSENTGSVNKAGNRKDVKSADSRKLEILLTEKLNDFERTILKGGKSGAGGFTISTAEASYKRKGNQLVKIEIIDTGNLTSVSTMTLAGRTMANIKKENASGYEKTTEVEGFKAFEKYDRVSKTGILNVIVADRYLVNTESKNISIGQLKEFLKAVNLSKLKETK